MALLYVAFPSLVQLLRRFIEEKREFFIKRNEQEAIRMGRKEMLQNGVQQVFTKKNGTHQYQKR